MSEPSDGDRRSEGLAEDDWRRSPATEDQLRLRTFRFATWWAYRPGWDHDHCEFCFAEISDDQTGHAELDAASVTADDEYSWVCGECFDDFRGLLGWSVASTPD